MTKKRINSLRYFSESNAELNFEEFLICCWNILTATDIFLAKFVFELFDVDKSGYLTVIELHELVHILCGVESDSAHYLALELQKENLMEGDYISFATFFTFVNQDPVLLLPVCQARDRLRKETLGTKRWIEITKQKSEDFDDKPLLSILRDLRFKPACYRLKNFR